ncbi:hypothetical protein GEZ65_02675 [Escherichia albertii]|nr:hypothetical protein [Escherichia albertii]EEW0761958.1 hypothetical protein [Escherichia albertii]EEW0786251.1 hypothetical protein [Escherichia albertii]EEW3327315.1 hypothetical protein [Escherichia albertii]EEW4356627.1 hypothetical protein [Escherichia albertii]
MNNAHFVNNLKRGASPSFFIVKYSLCLPLFIQQTVDAVCARTGDCQQQKSAGDSQVFHKHQ